MIVAAELGVLDGLDHKVVVVRDREKFKVSLSDGLVLLEHDGLAERHERIPERAAVEDDGDGLELSSLEERDDLEELVHRAEASREEHEHFGRIRERDLACKEKVEGNGVRGVRVVMLLHRQADRDADGFAARLVRAAVAGLHDAGASACDDGVALAFLCDASCENASLVIELVALLETRRSVKGHGLLVRLHLAHALLELLVDAADAHAGLVRAAYLDAAFLDVLRRQMAVGDVVGYLYGRLDVLVVHRHISYHRGGNESPQPGELEKSPNLRYSTCTSGRANGRV